MKNARKEIENPVCAIFAHTAADGKTYKTQFYALQEDWATRLDSQAKLHAETEWEKYRIIQDKLFESDFDQFLENEMSYIPASQINISNADSAKADSVL